MLFNALIILTNSKLLCRPVSAYALFFRDTQAAIKGQNPSASFGEVSKIVASMWDALDSEHKNVSLTTKQSKIRQSWTLVRLRYIKRRRKLRKKNIWKRWPRTGQVWCPRVLAKGKECMGIMVVMVRVLLRNITHILHRTLYLHLPWLPHLHHPQVSNNPWWAKNLLWAIWMASNIRACCSRRWDPCQITWICHNTYHHNIIIAICNR